MKKLLAFIKSEWEWYCAATEMTKAFDSKAKPNVLEFIQIYGESFLRSLYCRLTDHDLIDEGFATPDSGCIDIVCKRCGWSAGRQWLY